MKKLILTALAALTVSAPAIADRWLAIGVYPDFSETFYLNTSTIQKDGEKLLCWEALVPVENRARQYDWSLIQLRVHCSERTMEMISINEYRNNQLYSWHRSDNELQSLHPPPGSAGEDLIKEACFPSGSPVYIDASSPEGLKNHARAVANTLKKLANK